MKSKKEIEEMIVTLEKERDKQIRKLTIPSVYAEMTDEIVREIQLKSEAANTLRWALGKG